MLKCEVVTNQTPRDTEVLTAGIGGPRNNNRMFHTHTPYNTWLENPACMSLLLDKNKLHCVVSQLEVGSKELRLDEPPVRVVLRVARNHVAGLRRSGSRVCL